MSVKSHNQVFIQCNSWVAERSYTNQLAVMIVCMLSNCVYEPGRMRRFLFRTGASFGVREDDDAVPDCRDRPTTPEEDPTCCRLGPLCLNRTMLLCCCDFVVSLLEDTFGYTFLLCLQPCFLSQIATCCWNCREVYGSRKE